MQNSFEFATRSQGRWIRTMVWWWWWSDCQDPRYGDKYRSWLMMLKLRTPPALLLILFLASTRHVIPWLTFLEIFIRLRYPIAVRDFFSLSLSFFKSERNSILESSFSIKLWPFRFIASHSTSSPFQFPEMCDHGSMTRRIQWCRNILIDRFL